MSKLEILLLIMAIAVLLFVRQFCWVRVSKKRGTRLYISSLWAALAAALGVGVLTRYFYHGFADDARGTYDWAPNGFIRWALIIVVSLAIAAWVWVWVGGKSCDTDP